MLDSAVGVTRLVVEATFCHLPLVAISVRPEVVRPLPNCWLISRGVGLVCTVILLDNLAIDVPSHEDARVAVEVVVATIHGSLPPSTDRETAHRRVPGPEAGLERLGVGMGLPPYAR
jgi:hypothetical protein